MKSTTASLCNLTRRLFIAISGGPEGFAIDEGNVSGPGDVSFLAKAVLWHFASTAWREFNIEGKNPVAIEHESDCTCSIVALAALKFPTGNSSRLEEEFHEVEIPGAPENAIHGHDLTLGTGSYDGIFGVQSSLRYKIFFAEANGQFTLPAMVPMTIILPTT